MYRYTTLVFGYIASPFILNFIVKFHADQFPQDDVTFILKNQMYVDNLIYTSDSSHNLISMFRVAYDRMQLGGFELRSWASNCAAAQSEFIKNGCATKHGCDFEKFLGYSYFPLFDCVRLVQFDESCDNLTKRKMLSNIAKLFDPLGLVLPVTVKGKVLMPQVW